MEKLVEEFSTKVSEIPHQHFKRNIYGNDRHLVARWVNCPKKKQKFMKDLTHATYCKRKFDAKNNNCNIFSTVPCK